MLRGLQRIASSLLVQAEAASSSSCSSSSAAWEAVRGISSSACAQRRLFPPAIPERPRPEPEVGEDGEPIIVEPVVEPGVVRPYLVDRLLGEELMARRERNTAQRQDVVREYERFPGDTGSSEVQVALLTRKIYDLAEHLRTHRKDHSSRRGLEAMLTQRRKLLQYLRRSAFDRYAVLIARLGLKDAYGPQDRFSARYKPAVRAPPTAASGGR